MATPKILSEKRKAELKRRKRNAAKARSRRLEKSDERALIQKTKEQRHAEHMEACRRKRDGTIS